MPLRQQELARHLLRATGPRQDTRLGNVWWPEAQSATASASPPHTPSVNALDLAFPDHARCNARLASYIRQQNS